MTAKLTPSRQGLKKRPGTAASKRASVPETALVNDAAVPVAAPVSAPADAAGGEAPGRRSEHGPVDVCIVTGLSGAGKSTALQVFEDMGYFTVDGLPGNLVPDMVAMMRRPSMLHFKGIALGMDVRHSGFVEDVFTALQQLKKNGLQPQIFFLEASPATLMRRYVTTRRPHPLEREGMGLEAALMAEQERLFSLRNAADTVLDTSLFSIHQLRQAIQRRWSGGQTHLHTLKVNVMSFGFKYGVPKEADMVFDLRFLPNPYFVEKLRPLSGKDAPVAEFVFADTVAREFRCRLTEFVLYCLPIIEAEGRFRLSVAVGCTGGRHRSVAMAEYLYHILDQAGYPTGVEHRHLELG